MLLSMFPDKDIRKDVVEEHCQTDDQAVQGNHAKGHRNKSRTPKIPEDVRQWMMADAKSRKDPAYAHYVEEMITRNVMQNKCPELFSELQEMLKECTEKTQQGTVFNAPVNNYGGTFSGDVTNKDKS